MITRNPIFEALYTLSGNEKKNHDKAVKRIENIFCPKCKNKILRVVSDKDCLIVTKKDGWRKYKKVKCKNFKRRIT